MSSCSSCSGPNPSQMCAARMSDGRAFTNYAPRCAVHAEIMQDIANAGMMQSSYEARIFMQRNAEKLMERERVRATERLVPCAPCKRPFTDNGTMGGGERYVVRCDPVSCSRTEVNPFGIGDGRKY